MINDRRRHVAQSLSSRHQPAAKLGVLKSNLLTRERSQVGPEISVPREHVFAESHVGPERGFFELSRHFAMVKVGTNCAGEIARTVECKPARRHKPPYRKDTSP